MPSGRNQQSIKLISNQLQFASEPSFTPRWVGLRADNQTDVGAVVSYYMKGSHEKTYLERDFKCEKLTQAPAYLRA